MKKWIDHLAMALNIPKLVPWTQQFYFKQDITDTTIYK